MTDEQNMFMTCPSHPGYVVPMIYTFAFLGAEYWCPHCGYKCGMFGSMSRAPVTKELQARHDAFKEKYRSYLRAMSVLCCISLDHKGVTMSPEDLPEETKQQHARDRETWKANVRVEKETSDE